MKNITLLLSLTIFSFSCKTSRDSSVKGAPTDNRIIRPVAPFCAAVRGNGELIFGHFGALARITEEFGVIQGYSGGSSASISNFIYESIFHSDFVRCNGESCKSRNTARLGDDDLFVQNKISLMLKSLVGYKEFLEHSNLAANIFGIIESVNFLRQVYSQTSKDFQENFNNENYQETMRHLKILTSKGTEVAEDQIINHLFAKPILGLVQQISHLRPASETFEVDITRLKGTIEALKIGITGLGSFNADSSAVFFRTGLINFSGLARLFGKLANFYAGTTVKGSYTGSDRAKIESSLLSYRTDLNNFVSHCSGNGKKRLWFDIKNKRISNITCGNLFNRALTTHRTLMEKYDPILDKVFNLRIKQKVGEMGDGYISLATTSFIFPNQSQGSLDQNYRTALSEYNERVGKNLPNAGDNLPFNAQVNNGQFKDLRFGYWTTPDIKKTLNDRNPRSDLKSRKRFLFENATWGTVLGLSPAEPGLAPALEFSNWIDGINTKMYSTGGWSDLHPVQIMRDAGCKTVVYITRTDQESQFGAKIAKHLGMSKEEQKDLYSLGPLANSSFNGALQSANMVWCTHWNSFALGQTKNFVNKVFSDAYNANFQIGNKSQVNNKILHNIIQNDLPENFRNSANLVGCTDNNETEL